MAAALARIPDESIGRTDWDGVCGIVHFTYRASQYTVPREVIPINVKRVFQEEDERKWIVGDSFPIINLKIFRMPTTPFTVTTVP